MLQSLLLGGNAELVNVANGTGTIRAPETSDAVARIQQALICAGYDLPNAGVDAIFGSETGDAVSAFKTSRGLSPADPVVGVGTGQRLDLEISYLEGNASAPALADPSVLALDPLFAAALNVASPGLEQSVLDFLQLGDEFCFRVAMVLGVGGSQLMGRIVEPFIFKDYCSINGPCTSSDFFDAGSSAPYTDFLLANNPGIDPAIVGQVGQQTRPDILSHRTPVAEWYEIKPLTVSGIAAGLLKASRLPGIYGANGFPYVAGKRYTPTPSIPMANLVGPQGEQLQVNLHARRSAPGLIFYEICVSGDWVLYFNRVRVIAGFLAIIAALAPEVIPAAELAAAMQALAEIAAALGAGTLPTLTLAQ